MKLFFRRLILIHILLFTAGATAFAVSDSREGHYALQQGTDGCPVSVDWTVQCHGFTLEPQAVLGTFPTERFCYINGGRRTTHDGAKHDYITVEEKNKYVHKIEANVYGRGAARISLTREDTVILGEDDQFVWEHSQNGKGFSCLYLK